MRVTQNMLTRNNLNYINKNYQRYGELQDQLMSGKKITRPSQDPVIAIKGMRYRSQVAEVEQFQRNLSETYSWMDNSESALGEMTNIFQRLKELTVQASNDTYDPEQRRSIAMEINELQKHIESIANTKVNDKYIFNGTEINVKPVDLQNIEKTLSDVAEGKPANFIITYQGKQFQYDNTTSSYKNGEEAIFIDGEDITFQAGADEPGIPLKPKELIISGKNAIPSNNQDFEIEVMKGIHIGVNIQPNQVFSAQMFKDISDLSKALENPNTTGDELSSFIDKIDRQLDTITAERAELGARLNRVELIENRLSSQEITAKATLSENEDVDFEKVIIELTTQESIHRAALQAGAKIIQPTLMDFLR